MMTLMNDSPDYEHHSNYGGDDYHGDLHGEYGDDPFSDYYEGGDTTATTTMRLTQRRSCAGPTSRVAESCKRRTRGRRSVV